MWNSASATSAAAPPPTPLNRATICGIAVIFTLRAPTRPTAEPISAATTISAQLPIPSSSSVLDDRDDHPDAADPVSAPRVLRRGEEAQREDEADDRDEVEQPDQVGARGDHRDHGLALSFFGSGRFLNISSMRSVTNQPPTTFARREHHRDEADHLQVRVVGLAEDDDRADDDDAVDEVRPRHQRRVQHRRHLRDHLEAEEDREREDRQLDHEREVHAAPPRGRARRSRAPRACRRRRRPAVISSSKSSVSSPPGARCCSSATTLRE